MNKIEYGTVTRSGHGGFGFIRPDNGGADVHFYHDRGQWVYAGIEEPEFKPGSMKIPFVDCRIAFRRESLNASVSVWTYETFYKKVLETMAKYPECRIVKQSTFMGESVPRKVTPIAIGKLPVLLQWIHTGKVVFVPLHVVGNCATRQWFEEKQKEGAWTKILTPKAVNPAISQANVVMIEASKEMLSCSA